MIFKKEQVLLTLQERANEKMERLRQAYAESLFESEESLDEGDTVKHDKLDDWENHAKKLGYEVKKDNKAGVLHAYKDGDHRGEYFMHGKLQNTGRIIVKESSLDEVVKTNATLKVDGKTFKTVTFKSVDEANKFMEKNEQWGVIGEKNGVIHVANLEDDGVHEDQE